VITEKWPLQSVRLCNTRTAVIAFWVLARQPEQDHAAGCGQAESKRQLAEILVMGYDQTLFHLSPNQDDLVAFSAHRFLDG
jgi:hypothetical protein